MLPSLAAQLESELHDLQRRGTFRSTLPLSGLSRTRVQLAAGTRTPLLSFSSNDYLGLSSDPRLYAAASAAFSTSGFGAAASRLISGTLPDHEALESELAAFTGLPATLLFPSGYQANIGAITALAGPEDLIVFDRFVHASLIDAFRLSRAKLAVYRHLDIAAAERHLSGLGPRYRRRFLVTESLFSMDGDIAPLPTLARLAAQHDAAFVVDEAHAFGALGPSGRGLCAQFGLLPDVFVATLGKAFGVSGAFVAGSQALRSILVNRARPFIYTTAAPPPVAAAARAALRIVSSSEGDLLRSRLSQRALELRAALTIASPIPVEPDPPYSDPTPILPVILGDSANALAASDALRVAGIFVQAVRPPTVPPGRARLRITLSASHTAEDVAGLAAALAPILGGPSGPHPGPVPSPTAPPADPLPPRPPGLVLLGTDTSVGKTAVGCALLHLLRRRGRNPVPFKPAETGAFGGPSDAEALRRAACRGDLPLDVLCPYCADEPVAPAIAFTGPNAILPAQLLAAAKAASLHGDFLLVETAGGLLSPYAPSFTGLDLAGALGLPLLLVARNALGTVNHTALAVAEIRRRALPLPAIVLTTTAETATPDQASNALLIARETGIKPIGVLPYLPSPTPSSLAAALETHADLDAFFATLAI